VKRLIHFSAIGVDRAQPSDFSHTKNQAEAALKASSLKWIILRPSVVIGRAGYGASAIVPLTSASGPLLSDSTTAKTTLMANSRNFPESVSPFV